MSNQSLISTTSSSPPSWDVFLSFRGTDIRKSFISHLYLALDQAGIQTFRDEPALKKGQEISSALLTAIEDSKMFVVVLSEYYVHSSWCLDELVHILSSKTTENQIVPVFYYVDPSDVRYLKKNYGTAFKKHEKRYTVGVIDKWKSALAEISKISGYHLRKEANQNESDIVQEIVRHVASQASIKQLHLEEYLYGIDSAVEEIYQKLRMKLNDVRVIGICGMGGIGKTTIAKAFYNQYSNRFDISCFIEDVKQYSQRGSPQLPLLQQLMSELLRRRDYKVSDVKTGIRLLQSILHSNKALIILDDLDKLSHLEWLARLCFSAGSRLVITTRDVNLLNQLKVDLSELEIYIVKKLEKEDSLQLFSYHAFRKPMPPYHFTELSLSFVTYAGGLPLALKVLGASLRGRTDISFWKAKYEKVKKIPENEIHKILRLSYDELADEMQKAMFLDIVFFFIGKNKAEAIDIFRSSDLFPEVGIPILEDRFLITINQGDEFEVHNLIQEMGREVIREESKQGNCRRLYLDQMNAYEALEYLEVTEKIEGLVLKTMAWPSQQLSTKIFERMPNLKLLEIIGPLHIQGSFVNCFHELRCIRWYRCSWTQLPSSFLPQKLLSLDMQSSQLKMMWKDTMLPGSYYLKNLKRTWEIIDLKMVEKLSRSFSGGQKIFHPSIVWLGGYVMNLKQYYLPKNIKQLTNLSSLNLAWCKDLKRLPEQLGDMKGLKMIDVNRTAIEQLPDSIGQLINLTLLNLSSCERLTSLPDSICKLKLLKGLRLGYCSKLERLPEQLGEMISLETIIARDTAIQEIPDSVGRLSRLQTLHFGDSKKLKDVPNNISNLTSLVRLYLPCGDIFTSNLPPDLVKDMKKLETLRLRCDIGLWLPMILSLTSLQWLDLHGEGKSLSSTKWSMNFSKLSNLEILTLDNWGSSYLELPPSLEYLGLSNNATVEQLPDLSNLKHLDSLDIRNCISLQSLPSLPLSLYRLRLCNNATVEQLPDLSNLEHFKKLHIKNCIGLQSLPPLPLNLKSLSVDEWTYLKDVPDLSILKKLKRLRIHHCSNLESIDLKQRCLEVNRLPDILSFSAHLPNKKIPEWFDFKSNGSKICFNIPSSSVLGVKFLGIALWFVYKFKKPSPSPGSGFTIGWIDAAINNKTEGHILDHDITDMFVGDDEEVQEDEEEVQVRSKVYCISRHRISIESGDRIEVAFGINPPCKVLMCGAHIILPETTSSTSPVSIN